MYISLCTKSRKYQTYKTCKCTLHISFLFLPNKRASQIKKQTSGWRGREKIIDHLPFQPHLHHFLNASNTLSRAHLTNYPNFANPSTMGAPFTIKPTDNTHQTMRWRVSTNAYKSIVARNRSFCCHRKCSITDTPDNNTRNHLAIS